MQENIKRFPRPLGTTALAVEYGKNPTEENLKKLFNHVLYQWTLSNGTFGGVYMDVNLLSQTAGIPRDYIQAYMRDNLMNNPMWQPEYQEQVLNGLFGQTLAWALEDRMAINQQVDLLRASQGGKYTPFISAELNKALKLKLDSSTSLQQVVRTFTGGGTTNIFAQFNQQNNDNHIENTITVEDARKLIAESQGTLDDKSKEAKLLETNYDLSGLPEVVATRQEGVSAADYGGNFNANQQELKEITDNYKETIEQSSREHHEMRREIEQKILPDAEDPEMLIEMDDEQYKEPDNIDFASQFINH